MAVDVTYDVDRFDEALDWFLSRVPMTRAESDALTEWSRRRAFWISGVSNARMIQDMRDSLASAVERGEPFEKWRPFAQDKLRNEWTLSESASSARLAVIYRNASMDAYNKGRHEQMTDPDILEARPHWMYDAILDGRTSNQCRHLDGTIKRSDDPFWDDHYPPLHHMCFAPGTPVETDRGPVAIESLSVGDLVLTHRGRFRPITATMSSPSPERLVVVGLGCGARATATAGHPALTARGWVPFSALRKGDRLFNVTRTGAECHVVGHGHGAQASRGNGSQARRWHTVGALGDLQGNARHYEQKEVHEHQIVPLDDWMLEDVGQPSAVKHGSDGSLGLGGLRAGVAMRRRVISMAPLAGLGRALYHFALEQPAAARELVRDCAQAGMRLLGLPLCPVLAIGGPNPGALSEHSTNGLAPRVVVDPLRCNSLGAVPNRDAVQSEEPGDRAGRAHAEQLGDGTGGLEFVDVEAAQGFRIDTIGVVSHGFTVAQVDTVHNIAVQDDESYIAGGIIVHNCRSGVTTLDDEERRELLDDGETRDDGQRVYRTDPADDDEAEPPQDGFGKRPDLDDDDDSDELAGLDPDLRRDLEKQQG